MRQERKYGKNRSYPIPVWNGILEHCKKIGPAIWVFLWCLDRITGKIPKPASGGALEGRQSRLHGSLQNCAKVGEQSSEIWCGSPRGLHRSHANANRIFHRNPK